MIDFFKTKHCEIHRGPPPSSSRFQDRPQYRPRFGEREFREGREQHYHRGGHRGGQSRGYNPIKRWSPCALKSCEMSHETEVFN